MQSQAERTPTDLLSLWHDFCRDLRALEADLAAEAHSTAERLSDLL